jgi:hypothetical protein
VFAANIKVIVKKPATANFVAFMAVLMISIGVGFKRDSFAEPSFVFGVTIRHKANRVPRSETGKKCRTVKRLN